MASSAKNASKDKQLRNTAVKVRIYPDAIQAALLDKTFDCCRFLWNQMLADEQEFYAATDTHFIPTPAKYKNEFPFLKDVDSSALATVHQNLRRAFRKFFDHPKQYGYPAFKRKKNADNSYTTYCQYFPSGPNVYVTDSGIRLPKLGIISAKFHRKPLHWWKLKSATLRKTTTGKYFCSLLYEYEQKEVSSVIPTEDTTLGINYSLSNLYTDSDGNTPDAPRWLTESTEKLAAMQRKLSRMERGSKNYEAQLRKIRLLHEHIANQRRDFLHKESRRITNAYDAVCVSGIDLREASQSLKFGNVMDSGFGEFRTQLAYKLEQQGKALITVDQFAPTARTCSHCGCENPDLSPKARAWICEHCGAKLDRSENSAVNIKQFGLAQLK